MLPLYIVYLQTVNVLVMFELAKEDLVGDDVQDMVMFSMEYVQLPWLFHENILVGKLSSCIV